MKFSVLMIFCFMAFSAFAESTCDVRPGTSVGVKVIEFTSGSTIHSKMPFRETTADALIEEMTNLQDMGVCAEKIIAQKCVLKYESIAKKNYVTLIRGKDKWSSWHLASKVHAENFVKNLKRVGFCS